MSRDFNPGDWSEQRGRHRRPAARVYAVAPVEIREVEEGVRFLFLDKIMPGEFLDGLADGRRIYKTSRELKHGARRGTLHPDAQLFSEPMPYLSPRALGRNPWQRLWRMAGLKASRLDARLTSVGEGTVAAGVGTVVFGSAAFGGAMLLRQHDGGIGPSEAAAELVVPLTEQVDMIGDLIEQTQQAPVLNRTQLAEVERGLDLVNNDDFDALLNPNHKRVCLQGTYTAVDFMHAQGLFTGSRADNTAQENVRLGVRLANLESGCNPYVLAGGQTTNESVAGGATQFLEGEWAIKMMTMRAPLEQLAPGSEALSGMLEQVDVIVDAYKAHLRRDGRQPARLALARLNTFEENARAPAGERRDGFSFGGVNDVYRDAFEFARDNAARNPTLAHALDVVRDARVSDALIETAHGEAEMGMVLAEIAALRGADEVTLDTAYVARIAQNMQASAETPEMQLERAEAIAHYLDHQRGHGQADAFEACYMGRVDARRCERTLGWRASSNRALYMFQGSDNRWHVHRDPQRVVNNVERMLGADFAEGAGVLYQYRDNLRFVDVASTAVHPRRDEAGQERVVPVTDIDVHIIDRSRVAGAEQPRTSPFDTAKPRG